MNTFEIIHLSVIYWNLILQIIRSSHDEFRTKIEQCISTYGNVVFNLVYNSLSCVLFMMHPDEQKELARRKLELQLKQMTVDQKTTDALNSSIISNLTLSDFEIVTNEDLGINFWSKCSEQYYNNFNANDTYYHCDESETEFLVQTLSQTQLHSNNLMNCIQSERNGIFQISSTTATITNAAIAATASVSDKLHAVNAVQMSPPIDISAIETQLTTTDLNSFNRTAIKNVYDQNGSEKSLIYSSKNGHNGESKMSLSSIIENLKNGNSAAPNYNHIHLMVDSVQKLTQFVSKKVFGAIFNNNEISDETNVSSNECNTGTERKDGTDQLTFSTFDANQLNELHSIECKKLLMQLFEITLGIMLCEYKDSKAGKGSVYSIVFKLTFEQIF